MKIKNILIEQKIIGLKYVYENYTWEKTTELNNIVLDLDELTKLMYVDSFINGMCKFSILL